MAIAQSCMFLFLKVAAFTIILVLLASAVFNSPTARSMRALSSERYALLSEDATTHPRVTIQPVSKLYGQRPGSIRKIRPNPSSSHYPATVESASESLYRPIAIPTCTQKTGLSSSISGSRTTAWTVTTSACKTTTTCLGQTTTKTTSTGSATLTSSMPLYNAKCSSCVDNSSTTNASLAKPSLNIQQPKNMLLERPLLEDYAELAQRAVVSPKDFDGNVEEFILREYAWAEWVPHRSEGGVSSALVRGLVNHKYDMAVAGLYGCTSVVVVSKRGVWMSHFWEDPSFQSQDQFQTDVLDLLAVGDGTGEMPGIKQFIGPGLVFDTDARPHTLVITPRNRETMAPGSYEYGPMVDQIVKSLKDLFPAALPPQVSDYLKRDSTADIRFHTASGKLFFQYDPAQAMYADSHRPHKTIQQATLRVWLEDRPAPVYAMAWIAEPQQLLTIDQKQRISMEAEDPQNRHYLGKTVMEQNPHTLH